MDDGGAKRLNPHIRQNRSMVNKKGYIKTLEAVIAIIIIVIVSYTLIPRSEETPPEVPLILKGVQNIIGQSIQSNETIRNLTTIEEKLEDLPYPDCRDMLKGIKGIIDKYAPLGYDYTCAVCSNPGTCLACTPIEKNVYMTDIFVASWEKQQNPKIVRVWFWKKPTPTDWKYYNTWRNVCRTTVPCKGVPEPYQCV